MQTDLVLVIMSVYSECRLTKQKGVVDQAVEMGTGNLVG